MTVLLALSLLVAAFAQGYAQAKTSLAQHHELIIFGETGLETVLVDADGQLVKTEACQGHLSQDCLRVVTGLEGIPPSAMLCATQVRIAGATPRGLHAAISNRSKNLPRALPFSGQV